MTGLNFNTSNNSFFVLPIVIVYNIQRQNTIQNIQTAAPSSDNILSSEPTTESTTTTMQQLNNSSTHPNERINITKTILTLWPFSQLYATNFRDIQNKRLALIGVRMENTLPLFVKTLVFVFTNPLAQLESNLK